MTYDEILHYCLSKPGAFVDYPFGPEVTVVKVKSEHSAARVFTQLFFLKGEAKATLNCDPVTGAFYRDMYSGSVTRGYHCPPVQQPWFNTVSLDGSVPDGEITAMIDHAYMVVVRKLPKKYQKELEAAACEA